MLPPQKQPDDIFINELANNLKFNLQIAKKNPAFQMKFIEVSPEITSEKKRLIYLSMHIPYHLNQKYQ
jgi:hypothetical protein